MKTRILILDTAGSSAQLALAEAGRAVAATTITDSRSLGAVLHPEAENLLAQNRLTFSALHAVAVVGGPGSYTGLRVGMAAAKGLCFALDIPLLVLDRLAALGQEANRQNGVADRLMLLQARDKEWYARAEDANGNVVLESTHIEEAALQEWKGQNPHFKAGIGALPDRQYAPDGWVPEVVFFPENPSPETLAQYANDAFQEQKFAGLSQAAPTYLKSVYISKPKTA